MPTIIRTRLVKIGNSQGIRIPKVVLDQLRITDMLELEVQDEQLVLRPMAARRSGWAEQFETMAAQGDDQLLLEGGEATNWDATEWEW